ncbi:Gfo/Idh/MocA family protein [Curtobacterium sp. PhB115]|uniref:Gfo/Idh/MocA family protein n=1 Tax=Curtobacterium sp. PhB115 TaxID=2485173 RepID=UPI000F4B0E05|nr:Gfo/Idh/MocA family oxidoreductase [Curtobacterium sp. PhB115]ROP65510.1 putative dehydrogenase [Curtobacterium sp. PhB115]
MDKVRIGLVGYGIGGRAFHRPFLLDAEDVELVGVVARSAAKREQLEGDVPGVPVHDSLGALITAGVDAVVITTPPSTRRDLVLEAIAAGVAVVADKPFAPDPETARAIRQAAADASVLITPFHNRRWDTDLVTLRGVLDSGQIGTPLRFWSRFDMVERHGIATGIGGGVLSDIGSHLVDQAVSLFGPIARVSCTLDLRDARSLGRDQDGPIDAGFTLTATHVSGVESVLTSNKAGWLPARRLRLDGVDGTYEATSTDVQAQAAVAGASPSDDRSGWGIEPSPGTLTTESGTVEVPSAQSSYTDYYERFGRAVRGLGSVPVPVDDAVHVVEVLDAARRSAASGETVAVPAP